MVVGVAWRTPLDKRKELVMIRVFPRRTNWTPIDNLSFVGGPLLWKLPEQPVRISVTFSWDIKEAQKLYRAWRDEYEDVKIGGPAFQDPGNTFMVGQFVKPGHVFTSRGCPNRCPWCLAPRREGDIRELPIVSGSDIADNNLLACSRKHIEAVFDMLKDQKGIKFSGGLDARLLERWHVDALKKLRIKFMWFACDTSGGVKPLERVSDLLADFSIEKKRCYVLIGHNGEDLSQAEKRLERVYKMGFLPLAMLYRDEKAEEWGQDWKDLRWKWSRPAVYRATDKRKELVK